MSRRQTMFNFQGSNINITSISLDEGTLEGSNGWSTWVDDYGDKLTKTNPQQIVLTKGLGSEQPVLEWVIDYLPCEAAAQNSSTYACSSVHSECYRASIAGRKDYGYRCRCEKGYEGNPYVLDGCKDINEREDARANGCYWECINEPGSFRCSKKHFTPDIIIGVSSGIALLLLVATTCKLHELWKVRTMQRIKEKHFKNRGLFLQQLISSDKDLTAKTKIFPLEELEKATNNFDDTRIIGQGGHGTVYKGILSDQRIAAIKKAKIAKQKEIDVFINEVVILSQINHKNVVKLFGCCLESEIPLLVYEFVSNGTLNRHIEQRLSLSWEDRLRIATEASGALAYLHSSTSISIFHRDVKSSNILLDDNLSAKVSDFGASRSLPPDQTHLTTTVQGTLGYLDPEYYQTCQLTDKSDVYSFGVILLELLTGEKPISSGRCPEEINLRSRFFLARKEKCLFQLLEDRVKEEATEEELAAITMLAEMCLQLRGHERPTMKEVEGILDGLRRSKDGKRHPKNERSYELQDDLLSEPTNTGHEFIEAFDSDVVDSERQESSRIFSLEKEFISH